MKGGNKKYTKNKIGERGRERGNHGNERNDRGSEIKDAGKHTARSRKTEAEGHLWWRWLGYRGAEPLVILLPHMMRVSRSPVRNNTIVADKKNGD